MNEVINTSLKKILKTDLNRSLFTSTEPKLAVGNCNLYPADAKEKSVVPAGPIWKQHKLREKAEPASPKILRVLPAKRVIT